MTRNNNGILADDTQFLAALFAGISDAILVADEQGNYLDANPAATELLGYTREELLGMRVADITVPDPLWVKAEYSRFSKEGNWHGDITLRRKDDELIPTEVRAKAIFLPDHVLYVSIIREIKERRRLEESLREQTEVVETVNRLGQMLSAELDLKKLVQAVTDAATELTGARFGSFFYNVLDNRGESYMLYTLSGVPREAFAHFPMPRATDLFGPTFRGEGTIRISDVKVDERYGKNSPYYGMPPGHLPVTSYLAVPVVSRSGEVIGGLFFGHPDAGAFTERHERIVEGVAAQTSVAMDNARLFEAGQKARALAEENEQYYRLLADAVPQMVWTSLADGGINYTNRGWQEYTGQSLEESSGSGWAEVLHPDDYDHTIENWRRAVETGRQYQVIYRLRRKADGAYRWHIARALPLRDEDEKVVKWFGTCTDIDDQKRSEESLRFLAEASHVLSSSLEYEATLRTVARLTVPGFADWCAVDMISESGAISRLTVAHKDPEKLELARELHLNGSNSLEEVLRTGKSQLVPDIQDSLLEASPADAESLQVIRGLGLKSYIAVPLLARGAILGAITFVSAESGRVYDSDDLTFAEELAQRAALAVDNARLYDEARQAADIRQQAVELHRTVEERLSLLVQASESLISSPVLSEVLPAILDLSSSLVAADAYAVWRYDLSANQWRIVSSAGLSEGYQHAAIQLTDNTQTRMDSPVVAEDVYAEPALAGRVDFHRLENIQSLMAMPLRTRGRLSGTLVFYYHENHRFSELEIRIATALSNMAAAAITSAELYEEQILMRAEAERANRTKDEFLATVSHELRTPLNAIMGWSQILRRGKYDEASLRHAVETIERNARAQGQIINDILDVSRIITGKLPLEVRPLELSSVINSAIETVRPAAQAKEIRIETILDTAAGPVSGDANRLQQVIWNLLSNAVKFSPRGGRVQVRLERINSHIEITVSDTGKGISRDFLPWVFDRFRQADSSASRTHGGLGLGLAIVRHLVELHGGTVHAYSEGEGKGAIFTVTLPLLLGVSRHPQIDPEHPAEDQILSLESVPSLHGLRVLVIDDEADARELLKAMLIPCGAEVLTASSAAEAIEGVKEWKPDLIVSDIGMPGEDGYSLIRRVRALESKESGNIPAIALTAYARSEDRIRVLASGYQLHLPKPVEVQELAMAIASLSGRTGKGGGEE
ncbi:MAG TPA: GAF domain-containing protein [Blastocatellia bacterium]|jgi:PAS domain S-box-containing protein|nr:GAF domain-containing protein [Blastocatellia bacterium]